MDLGLGGRRYLLTGASRGLGFATARALVDDGARVLITARTAESVSAAVDELGGAPGAQGIPADLAHPDAAARLVAEARERLGGGGGGPVSRGGPPPGPGPAGAEKHWRGGGGGGRRRPPCPL